MTHSDSPARFVGWLVYPPGRQPRIGHQRAAARQCGSHASAGRSYSLDASWPKDRRLTAVVWAAHCEAVAMDGLSRVPVKLF